MRRPDQNYHYFCKMEIVFINLIVASRKMIEILKSIS